MATTITASALCPEHRTEYDAWLNYRIKSGIPWAASSARDLTVAGVLERQRFRAQQWRETINSQQALILAACTQQCHGKA